MKQSSAWHSQTPDLSDISINFAGFIRGRGCLQANVPDRNAPTPRLPNHPTRGDLYGQY
jgi:hypothetical protein